MENYFNYFTRIEEYFWKKRGTALLLSTLDWALIDSWQQANLSLEAILKGIDRTFEKYEARRQKMRRVNSLAYCHQEVLAAASELERASLPHASKPDPFPREDLTGFLMKNSAALQKAAEQFDERQRPESAATFRSLAASLAEQAAEAGEGEQGGQHGESRAGAELDLEAVERRMSVLEDKMFSTLLQSADEKDLIAIREEMDREMGPFRSKMTPEQYARLETQFLHRWLLERADLPRLSLFYL